MRWADLASLAAESLWLHRQRTILSAVGVGIGVAGVLVLAGIGDAAKRYVIERFAQMGTNLLVISPGRTETSGAGGVPSAAERDLTLEDCEAIRLRIPGLRAVLPVSLGSGSFRFGDRHRDVYVVGVTSEFATVRELAMGSGRFLPPGQVRAGGSVVVLGQKLAREVFGSEDPVGQMVRIAQRRFRVIGVMTSKGQSLGFDFDEMALVPVATGLRMFDQASLHQVALQISDPQSMPETIARVKAMMTERHRGEDFTIVTQEAMLKSFRAIADALTAAVAAIAAIAVAVAGVGIMNVMLIGVSERVAEIGLLKALGARSHLLAELFLVEALLLTALGVCFGVAVGTAMLAIGARLWTGVPIAVSSGWLAIVLGLAFATGGLFGLAPARAAATWPAAQALRGKR